MLHLSLSHPKTFAYAGFLAMIPKVMISLFIGINVSVSVQKNICLNVLIVSYPFIALMVDGLLYGLRHRLWQPLPSNTLIPAEWEVNAEELEQYARNLPKVRIMRIVTIPILMAIFVPFLKEDDTLPIALFKGFILFFFLSAFFDPLWRSFFKVKKPKIIKYKLEPIQTNSSIALDEEDEYEYISSDDANPGIIGTSAWIARQNLE